MQAPKIPESEQNRLQTLRNTELLDSNPEQRFDRLTRMAQRLFDVPIALVSLVDSNRQWFKSCIGLPVKETSREISFCGHAILDTNLFVIEDASKDPRFADNPLVTGEPHIRFYAGYPLQALNGEKMGTLCIIDQKPRQFGQEDRLALIDLGKMAEQEIKITELALNDELTGLSNRRGFMTLARQMQKLSDRNIHPLALIYFDLDNFKSINDTYGHAQGDAILRAFADALQRTARDADLLARLGGDEFAWLLSSQTENEAVELIERLEKELSGFNAQQATDQQVRFSHGIAHYTPRSSISIDQLLAEADAKMYKNKYSSR